MLGPWEHHETPGLSEELPVLVDRGDWGSQVTVPLLPLTLAFM